MAQAQRRRARAPNTRMTQAAVHASFAPTVVLGRSVQVADVLHLASACHAPPGLRRNRHLRAPRAQQVRLRCYARHARHVALDDFRKAAQHTAIHVR